MIDRLLSFSPLARRAVRADAAVLLLFIAASGLSAALLFAIQPMFTRMVLPRFGGSASVWSVAMVFFQAMLLAGYAYAHVLARFVPLRFALVLHAVVLALGLAFLPLQPRFEAAFGNEESLRLLVLLTISIGVPFVALSANAPLLQICFANSGAPRAGNPYPLYAVSNAGSLAALLAYPSFLEPLLTLRQQALGWSVGYGALLLLLLLAALAMLKAPALPIRRARPHREASWSEILRWTGLALTPSAALVAVTLHLSTDIVAAPFLWVAPLALYLATFIIAFGVSGTAWLDKLGKVLGPSLLVLALLLTFEVRTWPLLDVLLHLTVFFLLALYSHGRLAACRPDPGGLTGFYLSMSSGGVLGGALCALAAPSLFTFVAEYPIALALAAFSLPRFGPALAAILVAVLLFGRMVPLEVRERETLRSFYGVHTIETTADGQFRSLRHGVEVHGAQQIADRAGRPVRGKPVPLTYYSEDSPISEAIDAARTKAGGGALRVGVVGLGAGSIACLVEPSDTLHFYEIDPVVIGIARDRTKFRFLSDCAPNAAIIAGDARLTLEREAATYDILILDAFSSDSIPAHLLTREALSSFVVRLAPQGTLLLHISSNHLRLQEVVAATALSLELAVRINDEEQGDGAPAMTIQPTVAVLARKSEHFGVLNDNDDWQAPGVRLPRPWTDDYANPLGAFLAKLRER
ncbi:MAG TPA: fused MFS/spermidine synthase [Beijerinckiaceae bacterium]|nr:fused MFS/spermidine synthase [Beijerinckiaceae bacterium]